MARIPPSPSQTEATLASNPASSVPKKLVAVIGAGSSGLTAVKCCLEEGLEPTCYEKSAYVGGLWHFTEEPKEHQASIYRSTTTNGSKIFLCYSDFPQPKEWPNFLPNRLVAQYLENYASHFHLHEHVKLRHEVVSVMTREGREGPKGQGGEAGAQGGAWEVTVKDLSTGEQCTEVFDAVMVCAGLHRDPVIPQFPGLDSFEGKVMHTHDYKDPEAFRNKKVLVVGFGDCAIEAAVAISRVNQKVYVSTRHGNWMIPRIGPKGLPYDLMLYDRSNNFWNQFSSLDKINNQIEAFCSERFDHDIYNIKPPWRFTQSQPLINEELPWCVIAGYVELRDNIASVGPRSVEFTDGTTLDDVDVIIMGTGYSSSYPFVESPVPLKTPEGHFDLYKWVFLPDDKISSSLAVIGGVRVIGGHFPTFELQSRLATRVFNGKFKLPDVDTMKQVIKQQQSAQEAAFLGNPRHYVTLGWLQYNDCLAEMIGCKPSVVSLFMKDHKLAKAVWYEPCVPAQYRLTGPGAWAGARDVILGIQDSLLTPLKNRNMTSEPDFQRTQNKYGSNGVKNSL